MNGNKPPDGLIGYVAFMEKNSKYLDDEMIIGVIYALKETYPCRAPKSQ